MIVQLLHRRLGVRNVMLQQQANGLVAKLIGFGPLSEDVDSAYDKSGAGVSPILSLDRYQLGYRLSNSNNMLTILKSTALPYIITYKNYCTYFWQWFQYNIPFLIVWYWSAHLSLREVRLYISSQFLRKTHRICRHLLLLAQSLKHCLRRLYGCFDENWRRICFGNLIRTLYCSLLGLLRPVVLEVITQAIFKISNVILWRVVIASGV